MWRGTNLLTCSKLRITTWSLREGGIRDVWFRSFCFFRSMSATLEFPLFSSEPCFFSIISYHFVVPPFLMCHAYRHLFHYSRLSFRLRFDTFSSCRFRDSLVINGDLDPFMYTSSLFLWIINPVVIIIEALSPRQLASQVLIYRDSPIDTCIAVLLEQRDVSFWFDEIIILITFLSKTHRNEHCVRPDLPIKAARLPHFIVYL